MNAFDRITFAPNIMGGRACICGMRITVSLVVNLIHINCVYGNMHRGRSIAGDCVCPEIVYIPW